MKYSDFFQIPAKCYDVLTFIFIVLCVSCNVSFWTSPNQSDKDKATVGTVITFLAALGTNKIYRDADRYQYVGRDMALIIKDAKLRQALREMEETGEISTEYAPDTNETYRMANTILHYLHTNDMPSKFLRILEAPTTYNLYLEPRLQDVSKYLKQAKNLHARCSLPSQPIISTDSGSIVISIQRKPQERVNCKFTDYIGNRPDGIFPIAMGVGEGMTLRTTDVGSAENSHIFLCGMTGSGKSFQIRAILGCVHKWYTPAEIDIRIGDLKGSEFQQVEKSPFVTRLETNPESVLALLRDVKEEMHLRNRKLFPKAGVNNLVDYQLSDAQATNPLRRIFLILDEIPVLVGTKNGDKDSRKEATELLQTLASEARSAGITLMVISQSPMSTDIPNPIKANLATRIFGTNQATAPAYIQRNYGVSVSKLLGKGDLWLCDGYGVKRVQGLAISEGEIQTLVASKEVYIEHLTELEEWILTKFKGLEPLTEAEFTKVSHLNRKIKDKLHRIKLLDSLVIKGYLVSNESLYSLTNVLQP